MAAEPVYRPLAFGCTVYGQPAPQGSKKHVGGGRMIESNAATLEPWREAVKAAARKVMEGVSPFTGPLALEVVFTLRKPVSAPKRRRTWPDRKPDGDKLLRATMDALTDAGVWRDDGQVVDARAVKTYPDEGSGSLCGLSIPGCVIRVWRVADEQAV